MPDTKETLTKYLPYVLGGAAIIGGFILYKKGTGISSTSLVPYSPDTTATDAANAQMAEAQLAAQTSSFQTLLSFQNANAQRQADLDAAKLNADVTLKIKQAEQNTQNKSIDAARRVANTQSNNQLIGSVVSAVALFALFCYNTTDAAAKKRVYYHHGIGGV